MHMCRPTHFTAKHEHSKEEENVLAATQTFNMPADNLQEVTRWPYPGRPGGYSSPASLPYTGSSEQDSAAPTPSG